MKKDITTGLESKLLIGFDLRKIIGREIFESYIDRTDINISYFHPNKWYCCVYNISIIQHENRVYNF